VGLSLGPTLLGRAAFLAEVASTVRRPGPLPDDVPLEVLGFDAVERHLLLALLARNGAVLDETAAWALVTLGDAYERYALEAVDLR
jgi:hypothetical protein